MHLTKGAICWRRNKQSSILIIYLKWDANHSIWVLFSFKWCHGISGCAQRMTVTRNFGLIREALWSWLLQRASTSEVEIYRDMKGSHLFLSYNFKVKTCFFCSFSRNTLAKLSCTTKTTSKVQSIPIWSLFSIASALLTYLILYSSSKEAFTTPFRRSAFLRADSLLKYLAIWTTENHSSLENNLSGVYDSKQLQQERF